MHKLQNFQYIHNEESQRFFLIKKFLTRLCVVKIYNKFDIIVVFNKTRVEKNRKKKTFLTRYELFEYVIMSFELYNALEIF